MNNGFSKRHPDFAAIERHIHRAHAERSVAIGTWIADALAGAATATRRLFSTPAPKARHRGRLVAKASVPR